MGASSEPVSLSAGESTRVATFNVNGIRAACRRGFRAWLDADRPAIVALQEVRCPADLVPAEASAGYHFAYHQGNLAGRNGVGVLSLDPPSAVRRGFGSREFDPEGRYLEVDLPGLTVGSVYLPKGAAPHEGPAEAAAYARKLRFLTSFRRYLTAARRRAAREGREFLVAGDFNIAHNELDLKAWRSNKRSAGFLPEERAWFSSLLTPRTLTDVVRGLYPGQPGPYSWWSWLGKSFDNDAGWRIDYQLTSPGLARRARAGGTIRAASYADRISDHAPVLVEYANR